MADDAKEPKPSDPETLAPELDESRSESDSPSSKSVLDQEPTEAEVVAIMHDDDLLEYTSSRPSNGRRNSMFEFYKQQWKAAHAARERSKKADALRTAFNSVKAEPKAENKSRSHSIIVDLKAGLGWCVAHLWSWTAVGITAPSLYGLGVGAMYGNQPNIAACLYFLAV